MIFEIITILAEQVNNYLEEVDLGKPVTPENIAMLDSQNDSSDDIGDIVALTLLNINEETTLKNFPNHSIENSKITYRNSIINLNLYLLFSAKRISYTKSLNTISKIIEYFQGKKLFTQANTPFTASSALSNIDEFRFTAELYTPTFEELNYIWGTLGGKQYPSALYKVSLIKIERNIASGEGATVGGYESNLHKN
jgi:hypothetical protein